MFVNRDVSIRAVDGFIRVRWWLQQVKKTIEDRESCRVEIELNGLEVQVYNNATKYEQLRMALAKARRTTQGLQRAEAGAEGIWDDMDDVVDLRELLAVEAYTPSFFHRLSPVLKVVIHKGSITAGNPLIQSLMCVRFRSAAIRYTTVPPTHPTLDYSQTRVRVDLSNVTAKLIQNCLYQPAPTSPSAASMGPQPQAYRRFPGFLRFLKRLNFRFLEETFEHLNDENVAIDPVTVPEDDEDELQSIQSGGKPARRHTNLPCIYSSDRTWRRLRKAQAAIYKAAEPLLFCASLRLEYYADAPGPIVDVPSSVPLAHPPGGDSSSSSSSSGSDTDPREKEVIDEPATSTSPRAGLIITAPKGTFNYGPQENRLRAILQAFFFPAIPPSDEVQRLRQPDYLDIEIRFEQNSTIRIPFRGPANITVQHQTTTSALATAVIASLASSGSSPDLFAENAPQSPLDTPLEWMEIQSGPAFIGYKFPMKPKLLNRIQMKFDPDSCDGKGGNKDDSSSTSSTQSASTHSNGGSDPDAVQMEAITDESDPRILLLTSLHPEENWMHVSSIAIDLTLENPQDSSETGRWLVEMRISDSNIFFLREHADLLTRLGQDFAVPAPQFSPYTFAEMLANHRRMQYDVSLTLRDQFAVHLNMNERNVVDELTNMKLNSYYTLKGQKLTTTATIPMLKFQQQSTCVNFEAFADNLAIEANHCEQSTINHLYDVANEDEPSNFLFARSLKLFGEFSLETGNARVLPDFATWKPPVLQDSLEMNVEADYVKMKAVGAHMNLFDRFLDNYMSGYTKSSRTPPLSPNGSSATTPPNTPREVLQKLPGPTDTPRNMEVNISVRIRHPTVSLPLNLYSDQVSAIGKVNLITVGVRVSNELSLSIGVGPATIYLPACGTTIVTKPIANVSGISVEMLWRKAKLEDMVAGELSIREVTYRDCIKVNVGDIQLAAEPIHLMRAIDGVIGMFYTLFNRDNRPGYLKTPKGPYDKYRHSTIYLTLHKINAKIWGPRGVIQAAAPGLKLCIDTLMSPTDAKYLRMRLPGAKVGFYSIESNSSASKTSFSSAVLPEAEKWLEIGAINVPKVIIRNVAQLIDPDLSLHVKQLEFLRRCDETRGRLLPHIWVDDASLWSRDPSERPWIRSFFEVPAHPEGEHPSLVQRINTKIEPDVKPPPSPSSLASSLPKKTVTSLFLSALRNSRPQGTVAPGGAPLLTSRDSVSAVGSRLMSSRLTRMPSLAPRMVSEEQESGEEGAEEAESHSDSDSDSSGSDSDSSFYSAKSSSLGSTSVSLEDARGPLDENRLRSASVQFKLDDEEINDDESDEEPSEPADPIFEVPMSALLDHHLYDIHGGSAFPETDQLGEFVCDWSPDLALTLDNALNAPESETHPSDPQKDPATPRSSEKKTKSEEDAQPASPSPKKKKKTKVYKRQTPGHLRSATEPMQSSQKLNTTHDTDDPEETNEVGTALINVTAPLDAHVTPPCLVVLADAVDQFVHERIAIQTVMDRLQVWLVSQMIVPAQLSAGEFSFSSVLLQVNGVRLSLLQTHIGEMATNYITSLALGPVVLSMKTSSEAMRPAVYANVRYELPSLVVDARSRDMSVTLNRSTITVEQLSPEYAKQLMTNLATSSSFEHMDHEEHVLPKRSESMLSESSKSSSAPASSPEETHKSAPLPNNSKVIFSLTLTEPLEFLHRFVAPSYLATREAATYVNVGKVVGSMKDEFGAFVASVMRSWTPSVTTLVSVLSGVGDKSRLSHLVLYELLVQLRDVEVRNDPYEAFGRSSEAHRTSWMLIYVTRQRLLGSAPRLISDSRLTAGQVHNSTLVSVESVRAWDLVQHLKPHHMPPLLAGCIDLDYYLHHILTNDPDIVGSHFLIDELFLKRAQTTRQRFNVRIEGLTLNMPSLETSRPMPEELTRGCIVLLPVDVSALTKVSVRLPTNHEAVAPVASPAPGGSAPVSPHGKGLANSVSSSHPNASHPIHFAPFTRKQTVAEDLFISSSDQVASTSGGLGVRVLAPVTLSETQFLANSKGVKINVTPKLLDIVHTATTRWKASEGKKDIFHVRPLPRSTAAPARFALLEQMVRVSVDLFRQPSRDRTAISGQLVSDAFSLKASSRYGTAALDIPETTVTLSSLPTSNNGEQPASHTVILRLPVLKFAALIDGRRHLTPATGADFSEAPIALELSQLAACVMFTPSGISIVEEEGKTKEYRSHHNRPHSVLNVKLARKLAKEEEERAAKAAKEKENKENVFDALDMVVQFQSFKLPFRLPHPVYSQFFANEWTSRLSGAPKPVQVPLSATTAGAAKVPLLAIPIASPPLRSKPRRQHQHQRKPSRRATPAGIVEEEEKTTLPFLTRKVRGTFHGHFSDITFLMTQLADLPVKYHVPEVVLLTRHAEHEHALHVSVKSHNISFEPKKSKSSTAESDPFGLASTKATSVDLPMWAIESTVRQYHTDSLESTVNTSRSRTDGSHGTPTATTPSTTRSKRSRSIASTNAAKAPTMLRTDIQTSISVSYIQNILRAAVIKNLLVFQKTLRREIESVMAVVEEAKSKKKEEDADEPPPKPKEDTATAPVTSDGATKDAFAVLRSWPNVRWRLDIDWKGLEVHVESPHATIIFYTGHLRAAAVSRKGLPSRLLSPFKKKSAKKRKGSPVEVLQDAHSRRSTRSSRRSSNASSTSIPRTNPFEFRATLNHVTALLCPPGTKGRLFNTKLGVTETGKLDVWAGISTNLNIQSFYDDKFAFKQSETAAQPGSFQSWWILISNTHVLIQPWVGEKALLMWLYFAEYHSTLSRKTNSAEALDLTARGTSTAQLMIPNNSTPAVPPQSTSNASGSDEAGVIPLEGTNATIFVQVSVVGVLVPCNSLKGTTAKLPLGLAQDPRFNLNTVLMLRLERFTFSGSTHSLNERTISLFKPTQVAKPKRTQILANAVLLGLTAGFDVMDYEKVTLSLEEDALYKPPHMNHVLMSEADCRFVFVKEAKPLPIAARGPTSHITRYGPSKITGAVEMTTAGLEVKFNAQLYSHVSILYKCVELGQTQFNAIMEELSRQQQKEEASKPSLHTARRPRGGTVSVRALQSDSIASTSRPSTLALHAPSSLLLKNATQQSFQLDVSLTTTAGSIEVYACTSATKADASNLPLKPKSKKAHRETAVVDEEPSLGHTGSFKMPSPPPPPTNNTDPDQAEFTLLERIPLPQVRATYSKNYTSARQDASSPVAAVETVKRNNSNVIAIGIEGVECSISPDVVIFYHELLAQMSVMKTVLKPDEEEDATEPKSPPSATTTSNLFGSTSVEDLSSSGPSPTPSTTTPPKDIKQEAPAQPIDKDETWTIHFHLRPSILRVTSRPYSETTCAFKTGDIIVIFQSAYVHAGKDTPGVPNPLHASTASGLPSSASMDRQRVQQRSLLFKMGSVSLKMENPHFDREDLSLASLEVGAIRLHSSHTFMSTTGLASSGANPLTASTISTSHSSISNSSSFTQQANPLTVFLTIEDGSGFFSVRHLQETLLFFKVWQQGIYLVQYADFFGSYSNAPTGTNTPNNGSGAMDGSESSDSSSSTGPEIKIGVIGMLLEESSILLNVEIHDLHFVADLGPSLASVTSEVDYVIASFSAPGRSKMDPLGEIFDLVVQAGPFNVNFKGSLDGAIAFQQIGLHGRRVLSVDPTKPIIHRFNVQGAKKQHRRLGSSPLGRSTQNPSPNLIGRSIWSVNISPVDISLNYSLSPVLTTKCGEIAVAAFDSWRKKESEEVDDDDDDDPRWPDPTEIWEPVTNVSASLGPVELAISSETISMPTSIAKRLTDSIRKSNEKANASLKSMEQLIIVRRDLRKMKFQAGVAGAKPLDRLAQIKSLAQGGPRLAFGLSFRDDKHSTGHHHSNNNNNASNPSSTKFGAPNGPGAPHPTDPKRRRRVPIGTVKLVASSLNVRIFSFSLRDPSWFQLKLASFQLGLTQQIQKTDLLSASSDGGHGSNMVLSGSSSSVIKRSSGAFDLSSTSQIDSSSSSYMHVSPNTVITVSRELSLVVGGAKLSKITEPRNIDYSFGEQISESILVIPATTLFQVSSQDLGSPEIEVYFMTKFEHSIRVSIKLNLYTELKDTVASYQRAIDASKVFISHQAKTGLGAAPSTPQKTSDSIIQNRATSTHANGMRSSRKKPSLGTSGGHSRVISGGAAPTPASGITSTVQLMPSAHKPSKSITGAKIASSALPSVPSTTSETKPVEEAERVFLIKKFDFNPSVDVLGDFTPHISTVLGWLGIKDGSTTIPKTVHSLTDILETALAETFKVSRIITKQRTKWKNHDTSSSRVVSASPSSHELV